MKVSIHPSFVETKVICACGASFTTRSTKETISTDVCSKCHPFFTGEHRFIDTKGRVEEFQKKQKYAESMRAALAAKKAKKAGKGPTADGKSLRELLSEV
jgi:large subunit ribosomal protein L31